MALTIDHLRVDHRVTVLRDFTDAAGETMRAGETGILRGLSWNQLRMEIGIEIERGSGKVNLVFPLAAKTGPRNGHMKDYFEMGDAIETSPLHEPPHRSADCQSAVSPTGSRQGVSTQTAADCQSATQQTDSLRYGSKGQGANASRNSPATQPPNDTSLGERRVACDCDPAFHRELLSARGGLTVSACLCCGTVTSSRSIGDDGRFTGNSWQENLTIALPDPVHRWISNWPRVKVDYTGHTRWPMSADFVRYPTLYYPADTRCADLVQLAELEARLTREQSTQSAAAKLRATHRVNSAPPSGVPEQLCGYAMLWEALQLRPRSDLSDLIHHAQPRSPGCEIAAELLRQRADVFDLIVSSLRSSDATRRGVGFMIARDLCPVDPRLAGVLIELMNGFSFDPLPDVPQGIVSRGRFEKIFLLIAELRLATPEMLATLRTLMRKLARHDHFLVDCVRIVVRELSAAPQSTLPAA